MVFIPSTSHIFQRSDIGIISQFPEMEVLLWLRRAIGKQVHKIADDVSEERPWRHRVWQVNTSHVFFFHTKRQAALFLLRCG